LPDPSSGIVAMSSSRVRRYGQQQAKQRSCAYRYFSLGVGSGELRCYLVELNYTGRVLREDKVETLNLPAADCSSVSGGQLNQETTAKEGTIGGIKKPLKSFGDTGTNKASSLREELARGFDRQEKTVLIEDLVDVKSDGGHWMSP
jgi:hypothetical protein